MTESGNSAASRDIAYHVHGYTNLKKHQDRGPLIITGGSGIRVTDDSGKSYIEGLAGLWCTSLGFQEDRLIEAATALRPEVAPPSDWMIFPPSSPSCVLPVPSLDTSSFENPFPSAPVGAGRVEARENMSRSANARGVEREPMLTSSPIAFKTAP